MNSWTLESVLGLSLGEISSIIMVAVLIVGPTIWAAQLAHRTGRSAAWWRFLSVCFGPLALIVLYALSWNDLKKATGTKE